MLVMRREESGALVDSQFAQLPEMLRAGDLLVLNDSRVIPARLFAVRGGARTQANSPLPSGRIEVLLTEQDSTQAEENLWSALVRPARKVTVGERLFFYAAGETEAVLSAEVLAEGEFGERRLRFAPVDDFYARLERVGHMPLPPYIRREQAEEPDSAEDRERYQTVYSQQLGSAAAPTAGLHFTPEVLSALEARGVEIRRITLHVGLGTFQPVRVKRLDEIRLHSERYTLSDETAEAINRAQTAGRRIIAAGTTTTRTLEHVAQVAGERPLVGHSGSTSIFISPGHRFRVVSGLLTNFHLPESTLLMLVAAFVGGGDAGRRRILEAYAHAVRAGYRFYSYGDCMLLL